jgi:hypothetical protein
MVLPTVPAHRHSLVRKGHERGEKTSAEATATTRVQYHAHTILDKPPALRYRKSRNAVNFRYGCGPLYRCDIRKRPRIQHVIVSLEIKGGDGLKDAGNTDRSTNIRPV